MPVHKTWRLSMGEIRKSVPDRTTGRKTGTRNLCVRVQGKRQRQIKIYYLCPVFLPRIAPCRYFDGRPGMVNPVPGWFIYLKT